MPGQVKHTETVSTHILARALIILAAFLSVGWCSPMVVLDEPRGLPFEIAKGIEIASSSRALKPGALKLVCSRAGNVHLVVQARMPGPRDDLTLGSPGITLHIGDRSSRELRLSADEVAIGRTDTLTTPPLAPAELQALSAAFDAKMPGKVSINVGTEIMVYMKGKGDGAAIRRLAAECQR